MVTGKRGGVQIHPFTPPTPPHPLYCFLILPGHRHLPFVWREPEKQSSLSVWKKNHCEKRDRELPGASPPVKKPCKKVLLLPGVRRATASWSRAPCLSHSPSPSLSFFLSPSYFRPCESAQRFRRCVWNLLVSRLETAPQGLLLRQAHGLNFHQRQK